MGTAPSVHPTAIVDPQVQLGAGVSVGPYCVLRGPISLGAGTTVLEHSVIYGATETGVGCRIGPAAYVGMDPQHIRFTPDPANPTWLVLGNNVTVREGARLGRSIHTGKENATRVGNNCYIMGACHVAHDCVIEDDAILADAVLLAGHVHVGARTFMGGGSTIHQFVRIGRLVIVAGNEAISQDVPPFGAVRYGRLKGFNIVGCRRAGLTPDAMKSIRACYQKLRRHRIVSAGIARVLEEVPDTPEMGEIVEFIRGSTRGIVPWHTPKSGGVRDEAF